MSLFVQIVVKTPHSGPMGFPFFAERELMTNFAGHCLTCQKDRIVQNVAGMNIWSKYRIEYKELVSLGLPVLVTQAGIIVVSFADTMMVGAHPPTNLRPPLSSIPCLWWLR